MAVDRVTVTLAEFKDNLTKLEKRLSDETIEPTGELKVAATWIEFVQRPDTEVGMVSHLVREWLPKLVRAMLSRKYDWSKSDYSGLVTFLELLLALVAKNLSGLGNEVLYATLKDLLDPTQPLYTKYCVLKHQSTTTPSSVDEGAATASKGTGSRSVEATAQWLSGLDDSTYVDWLGPRRQWETGVIARFSDFRTELEIIQENGEKVWLSVEDSLHRVAPLGTQMRSVASTIHDSTICLPATSSYGPPTLSESQGLSETAPSSTATDSCSIIEDSRLAEADKDYTLWRDELSVGDLIDARDRNHEWFQACILELKHVDRPLAECKAAFSDVIDFTTSEDADADGDGEAAKVTTSSSIVVPDTKPVIRIAFIGQSESFDEWIDVETQSHRIQRLNARSNGRKGSMNLVRDEVLHLVKLVPSPLGEIDKFALYREGCFMLPLFIQLVNAFGAAGGFDRLLSILQHTDVSSNSIRSASLPGSVGDELLPYSPSILHLIAAVGPMHRVLSKSFLASFGLSFLETSIALLMNLSMPCLRETPLEALETALVSLEQIAVSHFGRNAATGRMIEPTVLQISLQNLQSPYLNRRLGGLKLLTDLVKKAANAVEYPSGLKIVRSTTNGMEHVSYRVMPVLYHYTMASLVDKLLLYVNIEPLVQIFVGSNAHDSLMARIGPVLCAMASQRKMDARLLRAMWEAGLGVADRSHDVAAWKCLSTVIAAMNIDSLCVCPPLADNDTDLSQSPSSSSSSATIGGKEGGTPIDFSVQDMLDSVRELGASSISDAVVDIIVSVASRCQALMRDSVDEAFFLNRNDQSADSSAHSASGNYFTDIVSSSSSTDNPLRGLAAYEAYDRSLSILWEWIQDGSGVSTAVVDICLTKLESLLNQFVHAIHHRNDTEDKSETESSLRSHGLQWFCLSDLVIKAIEDIRLQRRNLVPSVRVLRIVLCSWAALPRSRREDDDSTSSIIIEEPPSHGERRGPQQQLIPSRAALVEHLEEQFSFIATLSSAIINTKATLRQLVCDSLHTADDYLADLHTTQPLHLQEQINALKAADSRYDYISQLEQLLDFLLFFLRSSASDPSAPLLMPYRCMKSIWDAIVLQPHSSREVDAVIGFFSYLVLGGSVQGQRGSRPRPKRTALCSREDVETAFWELLCYSDASSSSSSSSSPAAIDIIIIDRNFSRSPFFSIKAFECIEKWFKWLQLAKRSVTGVSSSSSSSSSSSGRGSVIDVFATIVFSCTVDDVAGRAVRFITSLPHTLYHLDTEASRQLIRQFMNDLLTRCMDESTKIGLTAATTTDAITGFDSKLTRVLLLLDGVLQQSSSNQLYPDRFHVPPHGKLDRGGSVSFKVSSSSKKMKGLSGAVVLHLGDTVQQLLRAVAEQVHSTVADIKVFRQGKELSMQEEGSKLISQLPMIGFCSQGSSIIEDAVTVTERPKFIMPNSSSDYSTSTALQNHDTSTDNNNNNNNIKSDIIHHVGTVDCNGLDDNAVADDNIVMMPPGLMLSRTTKYFDRLLSLLRGSRNPSVVDRLWDLITRIPSSEEVLHRWLELPVDDVQDCLLRFDLPIDDDSQQSSLLSVLVYDLQIVHMLLQPVARAEDLVQLQPLIDRDLLRDWPSRFISKHGLRALHRAQQWIDEVLDVYLRSSSIDGVKGLQGVSPQLLQTASSLSSTMLRAFWIRICRCQSYRSLAATAAAVPFQYPSVRSPSSIGGADAADEGEGLLLHAEWGWRLDSAIDMDREELGVLSDDAADLSALLHSTVSSMNALHRFSTDPYFDDSSSSLYSGAPSNGTVVERKKRGSTLLDTLSNQFIVMMSIATLMLERDAQQDLLHPADCDSMVEQMVLMGPDSCDYCPLAAEMSYWFVRAIVSFIQWLSSYKDSSVNDSSVREVTVKRDGKYAGIDRFNDQMLRTALRHRPSAAAYDMTMGTDSSSSLGRKYKALFHLLDALLCGPTSKYLSSAASDEVRAVESSAVIRELRAVQGGMHRQTTDFLEMPNHSSGSGSMANSSTSPPSSLVEGSLMVVTGLVSGRDEVIAALLRSDPTIADFLLIDCLGLMPIPDCLADHLCKDQATRKYCYQLLSELARSSPVVAEALLVRLEAVHRDMSVPSSCSWDMRPERDEISAATRRVGLRNLGSTCYMNSLLQVLFCNTRLREHVLGRPMAVLCRSEEELRDHLPFQLQRLFYALQYSKQKAHSPTDWAHAFKDESGLLPVDVMQQQDAQEFLQLLAERFESQLLAGGMESGADIFQKTVGGRFCNQMYNDRTAGDVSAGINRLGSIREQFESFVCISLDVKGFSSLEHSLNRFVEGEQISDYQWEEGRGRESITKRQCLHELNDTMFFHLKRFQLNFDTFRREKVNDYFAFPLSIDMFPYSREGLDWIATNGPLSKETRPSSCSSRPDDYYRFELTGVVVHTGTSESGHYFSYIRQQDGLPSTGDSRDHHRRQWFEFNDSEVTPFPEALLQAECFGGITSTHEYSTASQQVVSSEVVNKKSAYMLVYDRVRASSTAVGADSSSISVTPIDSSLLTAAVVDGTAAVTAREVSDSGGTSDSVSSAVLAKWKLQVRSDNAHHNLMVKCLSWNHIHFYSKLMESCLLLQRGHAKSRGMVPSPMDNDAVHRWVEFVSFSLRYSSHTPHVDLFSSACSLIQRHLSGGKGDETASCGPHAVAESSLSSAVTASPSMHEMLSDLPPPPRNESVIIDVVMADMSDSDDAMDPQLEDKENRNPNLDGMQQSEVIPLDQYAVTVLPSTAGPSADLCTLLLKQWSTDQHQHQLEPLYVVSLLLSPKEDVRRAVLPLLIAIFQHSFASILATDNHIFANPERYVDVSTGLLSSNSVALVQSMIMPSKGDLQQSHGPSQESQSQSLDLYIDADDDPDLALAIKMSQESAVSSSALTEGMSDGATALTEGMSDGATTLTEGMSDGPTAASQPTENAVIVDNNPTGHSSVHVLKVLAALTSDQQWQLICDHWRTCHQLLSLLVVIAETDPCIRDFLLKRETIAQAVDAVLGDQSPLVGQIYRKGSRPRAPSSYLAVVPGKDDALPYAAKNIPDWSKLLELVAILVTQCRGITDNSSSLYKIMGDLNAECIQAKTLYSTIIKQTRYIPSMTRIVEQLCIDDYKFSDMVMEVVCEEMMSMSTHEGLQHLFELLEKFLSVRDVVSYHRAMELFGGAHFNLLEAMKLNSAQVLKYKLVGVFIRSFISLVQHASISNLLHGVLFTTASVNQWAPWMLKFCFRFTQKCSHERVMTTHIDGVMAHNTMIEPEPSHMLAQAQVNKAILEQARPSDNSSSPSSESKSSGPHRSVSFQSDTSSRAAAPTIPTTVLQSRGPYVRVYGEDARSDCELTWDQRAEQTTQLLSDLLTRKGFNVDSLLPYDTFVVDLTEADQDVPHLLYPANVENQAAGASSIGSSSFYESSSPTAAFSLKRSRTPEINSTVSEGVSLLSQLADGMSDEELAQLLQGGGLSSEID